MLITNVEKQAQIYYYYQITFAQRYSLVDTNSLHFSTFSCSQQQNTWINQYYKHMWMCHLLILSPPVIYHHFHDEFVPQILSLILPEIMSEGTHLSPAAYLCIQNDGFYHNILLSTISMIDYAIGLEKRPANGLLVLQLFRCKHN